MFRRPETNLLLAAPGVTRVLVVAHRGASRRHPENTIEAFRGARGLGADWVELDVRRTRDGALAVHHDAALPDGRLVVDVRAVELPPSVPLLDTALDACDGMGVNIEIKNSSGEPDFDAAEHLAGWVSSLVVERREQERVLVSSFSAATIDRVRTLEPSIPTALLTFNLPDPAATVELVAARGHDAIHPFVRTVDGELVERAHAAGLAVNTWTCDDPVYMRELVGFGVDGIVTNVPDIARAVVDEA